MTQLPKELKKWNWGAFFLTWIWGIGTDSWNAVWAVIPFFGFFWSFVCGAKGNEWAWNAKTYRSAWHFNKLQQKWAFWGFIITLLTTLYFAFWMGLGIFCGISPDKCPIPKQYLESNHKTSSTHCSCRKKYN